MDEAERLCDRVAIIDHGKIIALGSPRELIARLGGDHIVEFALESNGTPLEPQAFAGLDSVLVGPGRRRGLRADRRRAPPGHPRPARRARRAWAGRWPA